MSLKKTNPSTDMVCLAQQGQWGGGGGGGGQLPPLPVTAVDF